MNSIQSRIRIKDIARLSGVSEGTVDRVLHNRGEVSERSRVAVTEVLKELDYTPNLVARSLASKKHLHFVAIIPDHRSSDYWGNVVKGFESAAAEFVHHNVSVDVIYFNQFDSNSFAKSSAKVLKQKPDAVFIAPVFKYETLTFTGKLDEYSIPYSFLDSLVDESSYHTYYGQHSSQSGFIGARLLFDKIRENSKVLIVRNQRKGEQFSNQTNNRYEGFLKYINEVKQCCYELVYVELIDDDEDSNIRILTENFQKNPDIKGIITFNSKAYRLAAFLHGINRQDVVLVGYDLLQENVRFLKSGLISYLLAQRPEKQAYFTVLDMCNVLIFHKEVQKINYMPIDILMKDNIDYYVNFRD